MATTTTNSAATYVPIATTTLASSASSITFSSIPSTYTDLRLIVNATCSAASRYLVLQLNSDTGTNYSMRSINGSGTSAVSLSRQSDTYFYTNNNVGTIANTYPQLATIDIFSYTGSTYKTMLATVSNDQNGGGGVDATVGLWRSTSTINTILITYQTTGATFNSGSTATLYGILAA